MFLVYLHVAGESYLHVHLTCDTWDLYKLYGNKGNRLLIINPIQTGLLWPSLDWRGHQTPPPPLRFLKTIKDINMKLTPLIKRREINLLLLSYHYHTSHDVTKAPSWIFMVAILDFRTLSKRCQNSPFCQYSSETSTKN